MLAWPVLAPVLAAADHVRRTADPDHRQRPTSLPGRASRRRASSSSTRPYRSRVAAARILALGGTRLWTVAAAPPTLIRVDAGQPVAGHRQWHGRRPVARRHRRRDRGTRPARSSRPTATSSAAQSYRTDVQITNAGNAIADGRPLPRRRLLPAGRRRRVRARRRRRAGVHRRPGTRPAHRAVDAAHAGQPLLRRSIRRGLGADRQPAAVPDRCACDCAVRVRQRRRPFVAAQRRARAVR